MHSNPLNGELLCRIQRPLQGTGPASSDRVGGGGNKGRDCRGRGGRLSALSDSTLRLSMRPTMAMNVNHAVYRIFQKIMTNRVGLYHEHCIYVYIDYAYVCNIYICMIS